MFVGITGFGSVWRLRFGSNVDDPERFRRAAYFNTTGVMVNGKIIRRRKIAGHVRFNGVGGFNPYYPTRIIGRVFECDDPCISNGQNKVFFRRLAPKTTVPDFFLVVVRSAEFGRIEIGAAGYKSEGSFLISFSEWRGQQETMFLLPTSGWLHTRLGRLLIVWNKGHPAGCGLRFAGSMI